jgi:hypothetical protein
MQRWRALRRGTVTRGFNAGSIHQDYFRTSMVGSGAWATISSGRWITAETLEATERLFRNVSRHYRWEIGVAFNAAGRPSTAGQPCDGAVSLQNPESRILEGAGPISPEVTMRG